MHDRIKSFAQFLDKNGFSKSTIENYSRGVKSLGKFVNYDFHCSIEQIEQWKTILPIAGRTKNLYINGVRKFFFYLGIMGEDVIDPKRILLCREFRKEQDYITKDEVGKFLMEIHGKDKLTTLRNTLLVRILWETGLRVSELTGIKWEDIGYDHSIKVLGKGSKERVVFLSDNAIELLVDYRVERNLKMVESPYLFISFSRNSLGKRMSRNTAEDIVRKLNHTGKHITPHSFRHGFATQVLREGGNIVDLQKALGHNNLSTTSTYLHSNDERIKNIQKLAW